MYLKRIPLLAVLISTILVGCSSEAPPPSSGALPVKMQTVKTSSVPDIVEISGRLVAFNIAEIRPQVSGLIKSRNFTEGGYVRAGDVLYQIEPDLFVASYQSAQANLERSRAIAATNNAKASRFQELIGSQAISKQEYDDAIAQARQANADVLAAQAALKTASTNLNYARITAPISGYISKSNVTQGALVTTNQANPLATIQQLDPIYIDMSQTSSEARTLQSKLAAGQTITVRLKQEDGTMYPIEGQLKFSERTVDPTTGNISIRAVFPNPNGSLLPGIFTQAQLYLGEIPQAITVPQSAVQQTPQGDAYVYVASKTEKQQVAEQRMVRISGINKGMVVVREGLKQGDQVIISNLVRIRPGVPVQNLDAVLQPKPAAK